MTPERQLLIDSSAAMSEATSQYRTSNKLSGTDPNVPGWVLMLEQMQVNIYNYLQNTTIIPEKESTSS
jgi:hypothetical protein